MKASKVSKLFILGLVLGIAVVGCRKRPSYLTPLPGSKSGATVGELPPGGALPPPGTPDSKPGDSFPTTGIPANPAGSHQGWNEDAQQFKAQTVYFAFDSSEVRGSEQAKVSTVADFLKSNASAAVRVEGNCDERGTEEYNRALGDRRATSVREELVRLGIESGRVDTISYGEDKPADPSHDEAAWAKNRRADFILLTPPAK